MATRGPGVSEAWHQEQAKSLLQYDHAMDAAWHYIHAQKWHQLAELLKRRSLELASHPEHSALSQLLRRSITDTCSKVAVTLGESFTWSCIGDSAKELHCLQLALRAAETIRTPEKPFWLGKAMYALGYFFNARDPDQAISHLEASAQQFLLSSQQSSCDDLCQSQNGYVAVLATLAFVQLRRSSPQGTVLLHAADMAAAECKHLEVDAEGMLLKAQAEHARCNDNIEDAIRYRQQALVLYQRAGDLKEVAESHNNLGQLLVVAGRIDEARRYCNQVVDMAKVLSVRPETLLSAHGGLALAAMTIGEHEVAISHLHRVLRISEEAGLSRHRLTGLINLAEVHYLRFRSLGVAYDEQAGDLYTEQSRSLAIQLGLPQLENRAQSLKQATLNPQTAVHHLLPVETSAHPGEFAKIEALRAELALPRPPTQRARTHIALSQLYLRIAAKERDAARSLMQTHGLSDLESELEALQQTWAHDGNLASQLNQRWREQVGDWLTEAQRKAVLARLLEEGSLSKSSYGEAAEVSPATASKHLGLLADKGLLEQQGRGPATRYVLPSAAASSGGAPAAPPVH
ncbi:hypothetical protein KAK11_13015 [Ideonella paludis]|uniref:Tetratricopeptide repeat protein n=2 Tax=Ideonella paludis TaxID=1233411 RepID=A0ABS5DYX3_9BURK|nr:hypothetical protein [Ideonella paludis]